MNVLFSSEYFYWNEFVSPTNTVAHHANQMVFSLASASYKIPVLVKCKDKLPCLASGLICRTREWVIVAPRTISSVLHTSVISLCCRLNQNFRYQVRNKVKCQLALTFLRIRFQLNILCKWKFGAPGETGVFNGWETPSLSLVGV